MSMTNREIIDGLLEDGSSYVGHKREDLLAFLEYAALKCSAAGQVDTTISDLLLGVSRAPIGQQVYHERLLLLKVVESLDKFEPPTPPVVAESVIVTENQPTT